MNQSKTQNAISFVVGLLVGAAVTMLAGTISVEPYDPLGHPDIRVTRPNRDSTITSPFVVEGEARGTWYFEADFPVTLIDEQGNTLVRHYATAQDEWMTTDFVPFKSELVFSVNRQTRGFLILAKDDPSDLPGNDASIRIPVIIAPTAN